MRGLQGVFPGDTIILWQTEHVWRRSDGDDSPLSGSTSSKEKMNLAAIMVDTASFKEKAAFTREIYAPFSKHSLITKLILNPGQGSQLEQISALLAAAVEFVNWSQGLDLYSWGEDYRIFVQNLQLNQLPPHAEKMRFHDIRHLFRAYGVPADNYLSSTIADYFGQHFESDDSNSVLDNCRMLAMALKKLAQTV